MLRIACAVLLLGLGCSGDPTAPDGGTDLVGGVDARTTPADGAPRITRSPADASFVCPITPNMTAPPEHLACPDPSYACVQESCSWICTCQPPMQVDGGDAGDAGLEWFCTILLC